MKKKSIKKQFLALLVAVTVLLTYTPALSYALTEETEGRNDAAAEVAEDLATTEAETDELEEKVEDSETIDSLLQGLQPAENETVLSESKALGRKVLKSKAALTGSKGVNTVKAEDIRIFGQSRYDTAIEVANKYKEVSGSEKFENVVVTYGKNYPDALSGVYLAKKKSAPILLVEPSVEDYIANYIDENIADGGTVYILGGTGVVRQAFANKIRDKGITPKRLGGIDRYETNLEILREAGVDDKLLVCTGAGFPDSLSASAVEAPILLVGNSLTGTQKDFLNGLSTEKFYLIGGEGVVKPKIESDLINLGYSKDGNIKRLWGPTRYETSTAVAEEFFKEPKTVMLAYAHNFPDGLSGGPLALWEKAPIILTDSSNTGAARAYVESFGAFRSITLGGPSLISQAAVEFIMDRKPAYITPEKKYVKIQVGETVEIRVDSNYGTSCKVKGDALEEVGDPNTTYTEKGLSIENYTVTGKKAGTAVLVLTDRRPDSGLVTNSVTVTVIDGEASVKTLYDIINATGYKDLNGHRALEYKINNTTTVYFENCSGYVRLVCNVDSGDSNKKSFTEIHVPLEAQGNYSAIIKKGPKATQKTFKTDIDPAQYTSGTVLTIKDVENPSEEDVSFVTATFGDSMAKWNSVLEENYEMIMKDLGFTSY